jgi:tRNA(Arg) A34 adenosine deaminase TadA
MKNDNFVIEELITTAQKSHITHRHSACLIYKKEIISISENEIMQKNNIMYGSIHAEINTIKNFLKVYKQKKLLKNFHLIVIRISKNNKLINSKPCKYCIKKMKSFGIEKISYSSDDNIITEYIDEIQSSHVSGYIRHKKIKLYNIL